MKARIAVAAALLSVGVAAPADAAFKVRNGTFKVEIEGVQTNSWTHSHTKKFDCDSNSKGSGTEVIRFKSKPKKLRAIQVGAGSPFLMKAKGERDDMIDLTSKVTRRGERTHWGAKVCSYGDGTGGQQPPAKDCGTKRLDGLSVEVDYSRQRRGFMYLEQTLAVPLVGFKNCPSAGISWPSLLERDSKGREIGRKLPFNSLFTHKKNIIRGAGREVRNDGETQSTTTIEWTISLTRVGGKKR
jgi:hypothetical protein